MRLFCSCKWNNKYFAPPLPLPCQCEGDLTSTIAGHRLGTPGNVQSKVVEIISPPSPAMLPP